MLGLMDKKIFTILGSILYFFLLIKTFFNLLTIFILKLKKYECKFVNIFLPFNFNICFGCLKERSHCLNETVLLSTHNICLCSVIRKLKLRILNKRPGPEVIKLFPCSTQLSTKFQLLIKFKIQTSKEVSQI